MLLITPLTVNWLQSQNCTHIKQLHTECVWKRGCHVMVSWWGAEMVCWDLCNTKMSCGFCHANQAGTANRVCFSHPSVDTLSDLVYVCHAHHITTSHSLTHTADKGTTETETISRWIKTCAVCSIKKKKKLVRNWYGQLLMCFDPPSFRYAGTGSSLELNSHSWS